MPTQRASLQHPCGVICEQQQRTFEIVYTPRSRPTERALQEEGFSLITATRGSQGLRLLVPKPVDTVIIEYYLGLLDGAPLADEIKKVRPWLPIVMLPESLELPEGALKAVDALATSSDGPRFLLEAIHTVLDKTVPSPTKCQMPVVEDDHSVRESFAMTLMAKRYDVFAAEDGFRVLSQLRKKVPDVVLSDLYCAWHVRF